MLRIKYKNISMQFIALVVLCLWHGLMMYPWIPSTYAQRKQQTAYAQRQQPYYIVDAYQIPGVVYRIVNRKPNDFFRRRSGSISSIALWRGQLYFCSANESRIYQRMGQKERAIFEHTTYVRDVAFHPNGNLYFSEASGGGDDGKIYKLIFSKTNKPELSYRIPLKTVDGFWAGDFTFDSHGNLYLSSGNHTPAFIYRVPNQKAGKSESDSPKKVYTVEKVARVHKDIRGAIKGIAIEPNIQPNIQPNILQDFIYYADWRQNIYKLSIGNLRRIVEFSGNIAQSDKPHLSDIAFDMRIIKERK